MEVYGPISGDDDEDAREPPRVAMMKDGSRCMQYSSHCWG
jgi:hypothetical protein